MENVSTVSTAEPQKNPLLNINNNNDGSNIENSNNENENDDENKKQKTSSVKLNAQNEVSSPLEKPTSPPSVESSILIK